MHILIYTPNLNLSRTPRGEWRTNFWFTSLELSSTMPLDQDILDWVYAWECFPGGSAVKNLPEVQMWVQSLGWEDPLEKEMATYSSLLAWKIPRIEEPGGLQSMGLQKIGHNSVTKQQQQEEHAWEYFVPCALWFYVACWWPWERWCYCRPGSYSVRLSTVVLYLQPWLSRRK